MPISRDIYNLLIALGFNPVLVSGEKTPLGPSWSAKKIVQYEEEDFQKAKGIAITGFYNADKNYITVILDLDNVEKASEILTSVFDDWKTRLCSAPWSFCGLTGPRCPIDGAKDEIKCSGEICTHKDHEFKATDDARGMYVVLRVPANCLPKDVGTHRRPGVLEVIISNYQVVYGKHPSGLAYTPVKWQDGKWIASDFGAGEIVTCDEIAKLLRAIKNEEKKEESEKISGGLPEPVRPLASDPSYLIELLKKAWTVVPHHHDLLMFAIVSQARLHGIKKEELYRIFDPVLEWAVQNGHDTERDAERHKKETIEWVYANARVREDGTVNLYGKKKLEEIVKSVAALGGFGDNFARELISAVYEVMGVKPEKPLCIPITSIKERGNQRERLLWICNTNEGIISVTKKRRKCEENEESAEGDGEGEAERRKKKCEEIFYIEKKLVNVELLSAMKYRDAVLKEIEYVSASWRIVGDSSVSSIHMERVEHFVKRVSLHVVHRTPNWTPILDAFPSVEDIIVSGFACPPPSYGVPCKVRDYFGAGIDRDPDPAKAREAWDALSSLIDSFAPSQAWAETMRIAITASAFANFALTRKLWQVRSVMVALIGPRHTGKTTVLRIMHRMFFPKLSESDVIRGASTTLTAARIGRLLGAKVTTWIGLDEVDAIVRHEDTLSVLKSHATSLESWKTATGEVYPAYAGITLTANRLSFADPELADKIVVVEMTEQTSRERETEFGKLLMEISPKLSDFGAFYLKYAEKNWETVKDIVLGNPPQKAAVDYMNEVLRSLGAGEITDSVVVDSNAVVLPPRELFFRYLHSVVNNNITVCRGENGHLLSMIDCVTRLIELDYVPHVKDYYVDKLLIRRSIESEIPVNINSLCQDLGGEIYDKKSRNTKYYGACIVEKKAVEELLLERS